MDVDIDTSIQGVKGVFRPGDWEITAVMGELNRQQVYQYNPNAQLYGDLRHAVTGVRVERYGLGPVNLGAHAVTWDFVSETGFGKGIGQLGKGNDAFVAGTNLEVSSFLGMDWYAETNWYSYPSNTLFGGTPSEPGFAGYASTVAYIGNTTWLLEGKRYKDAERLNALTSSELYEVATPPSLEYERAITEDSSATVNSNDVWGARLRTDLYAGEATPYLSFAAYRDNEMGALHFNQTNEWVFHPVGGVEWFGEHQSLLFNAGYRVDDRDGTDFGSDRQFHSDIDFKFELFGPLHGDLTGAVEWYRWGDNEFQQADYFESENAFTLQVGKKLWAIWYTDYSDNPLVNSTGNLSDTVYGAAELQVKPTSSWTIKAFYGSYKAGIRCSGGQCRQLPGFEGTRISVAGNF